MTSPGVYAVLTRAGSGAALSTKSTMRLVQLLMSRDSGRVDLLCAAHVRLASGW